MAERGGALTVLSDVGGVPDPPCPAPSHDGGTLYAVSETAEGAVDAYRVKGGTAELTGPRCGRRQRTHAPEPARRARPHRRTRLRQRQRRPLRADGSFARAPAAVLRHTGAGPHAHQVLPDPSGRWAVSVDLGTDPVRVCTLTDGRLAGHREIAPRPGSGPRHLAFHPPDGTHAYVVNELTPTVTVCRWDAAGSLGPPAETRVLPAAPAGDASPSGLAVAPDGRFLWTATRGEGVLSVFALETDGERLRLVGTIPCGGHWPRALTLSGGFLYVADEHSGDVTGSPWTRRPGCPRGPARSR